MKRYYLAIDIGASSGRHILGHIEDGKLLTEEVYRFPNGMVERNGHMCWDVETLFEHIKAGMKKCHELGKVPYSVGIDTWGVDFVLLDVEDRRLGEAVGYRDKRNVGMDEKVYTYIAEDVLYSKTGLQKQSFNTIYQLMAVKESQPALLAEAKAMLMIPDYFNFLLTGKKVNEYTNATTTQLISPATKDWDWELIETLGYPREIFQEVKPAGSELGDLTEALQVEMGYNCKVILPATHDTGSAVMAVPTEEDDTLYISSGTWSLLGTEIMEADCSPKSQEMNFTNEGGYAYRFRYLKNIMGLWMIQSVKKEIATDLSFGEICEQASHMTIASIVDCDDERFLAPLHMTTEVQKACEEAGQQVPQGIAEVAAVIYNSLAKCYAKNIEKLEVMRGCTYPSVNIVGGGANAGYLNQLTANATGKEVLAGPTEGTAIGNLEAQILASGAFSSLLEARRCIKQSFEIKHYTPSI